MAELILLVALQAPMLLDPICPSGLYVWQRYDKRDKWDWIVKRHWKRGCSSQRIVWH